MHLLKTAGTLKHEHCTTEKQQQAPWALLSAESAPIKLIPPPPPRTSKLLHHRCPCTTWQPPKVPTRQLHGATDYSKHVQSDQQDIPARPTTRRRSCQENSRVGCHAIQHAQQSKYGSAQARSMGRAKSLHETGMPKVAVPTQVRQQHQHSGLYNIRRSKPTARRQHINTV